MTFENRLYKTAEVAKIIGVSTKSIYNYCDAGQLKSININGRLYFDGEELENFITRGKEKGYYAKLYGKKEN